MSSPETASEALDRPSVARDVRVWRGRLNSAQRVWLFAFGLAAASAVVFALFVAGAPAPIVPFALPWWVVAAGFAVADVKVVAVHFRRESHAFSLSEVPAVIGLFFLSPADYVLAFLAGTAAALLFLRQAPIKIAFNLANYAFLAAVMVGVFRLIDAAGGPPRMEDYLAAFAATGTSTILGALTIATVITLSGGAPQYKKLPDMLRFGLLVAAANTSTALLAVTILWVAPHGLWLLGIPILTLFLAYRAWVSEREKHERLELVYQSSRILQHSPELDVALLALLDHARTMFRAELAEVVLKASDPEHGAVRATSLHDRPSETILPIPSMVIAEPLEDLVTERRAGFVRLTETPGGRKLAMRQAMVAPLVGEAGVIGLITVANRLSEGTEFDSDDLRLLETLANQAAVALENGQLEQSLAELSRLKEQLRHQAYHDPLTGMPNRSLFTEAAESRIVEQRLDGMRPVILLLDLDDFKNVNDSMGHAVGDELLVMVAERIRSCVREDDLAARLGGDEFAILMDDDSTLARCAAVAERLVTLLADAVLVGGAEVTVGVSIGIAASRGTEQTADELLGMADVAMYTAKANGRRQFAVFDPETHAAIIARHELSNALSRAVTHGELTVAHQPIVDLRDGSLAGTEALARWRHPRLSMVDPEQFIGLAEASGAIVPLGRFIMQTAAHDLSRLRATGTAAPCVSVNVSAVQLQQPDFLDEVAAALDASGLAGRDLMLEITETAMFRDTAATIEKLRTLREWGVRIAVDDFGTGYSSLTYLRRFPVDILKIARDFLGTGPEGQEWAFTSAILALGRELGLTVIAEGVETVEQFERLRDMGCEFGQGFLFARPGPPSAVRSAYAVVTDAPERAVPMAEAS